MTTFTYSPSYPAQAARTPAIRTAQFGDGYEQRTEAGFNSFKEVWDLQFIGRDVAEAEAIDDFFQTHKGYLPFQWETPRGDTLNFICKSWTYALDRGNNVNINARFEQVFDPS